MKLVIFYALSVTNTAQAKDSLIMRKNSEMLHGRTVCPQQGDLRLSGSSSGQGAISGAGTRDRRVTADLRASSLRSVPPTSREIE
ncbi:hypothetical protein PoB_000197600 [Plakobranchus ocellatus]|uniref:Secreted protein n=1 Tax=Plakobranchus ocellatus TaxID=259542 RepID=A0AAV3X6P5_9GAST|nr:hypothetical protein PoB_000197600 [Plakobranchus ocellatus]